MVEAFLDNKLLLAAFQTSEVTATVAQMRILSDNCAALKIPPAIVGTDAPLGVEDSVDKWLAVSRPPVDSEANSGPTSAAFRLRYGKLSRSDTNAKMTAGI